MRSLASLGGGGAYWIQARSPALDRERVDQGAGRDARVDRRPWR